MVVSFGKGKKLRQAATDGDKSKVLRLVAGGTDVNAGDNDGNTPLHLASLNGHVAVAEALLANGANVNAETEDGDKNKNVLKLIASGAGFKAKYNDGTTPLHLASREGHAAVAEALLTNGAEVNAGDNRGWRPLHWVGKNGHAAVAEVLLAHGADVDARDKHGNTPLYDAGHKGHAAVAEVLLADGADVNAKDNRGYTPLHGAGENGYARHSHSRGAAAVAEVLLANGADVNAKSNDGITPLYWAASNGNVDAAAALLAKGADVNARDKYGVTPLHKAGINGHATMVEVLLAKGADANAKDKYGRTPRDFAASHGRLEVVRVLNNALASPNAFENKNASSNTVEVGAATEKLPPSRRSPGPSPDSDGAGEIPDRGPALGEPPTQRDASPPSWGGARRRGRSRAELTNKDFAFLEMGRKLVQDRANKLPAISGEERSALRDLTANMVDIERSLESVRELPSSLSNLGPEVAKYFSFFTSAFERAYVAAQALSSGAVKVQLNLSLEAFFGGTCWVAENCGIPFVGFISIFSAMMAHQQSAKKAKAFVAFEEFFRGNSRDQYLLTYRKLGEQFSLQLDVSSLAQSDPGKTSKLKERVKNNIAPIRKYLQKNHLDAIQQLSPIEEKAMADLASLTKEVLRLHQDERHTYHKLRASNEYEKASYFVGRIYGKPLESVHQTQNPVDGTRARSTNNSDGDTGAALQRMSEEVTSLKKITDANTNAFSANADMAQEFKQVKAQVRKLAAELNGQKNVTVPSGCQVQVQLNPDKPKEDLVHQLAGHPFNLAQMEQDIHQLQILHEKQSRDVEKMKLEHFINNRVLSYHEAFEFAGTIISMVRTSDGGKIELSDHGKFDYDGKNYRIGVVCKGGMFSKKRTLWKGKVEIKLETEHRGVKSVMDWFDETELRPLYERNKKEAIRAVFAEELESEPCLADMVQPYRYRDAEGDREKLGI